MVSYDYYRVFCCAARRGSFSRAAEELMSSQPAVSHIIANLEQQLGCSLFARTGRGIALTAEGELLYRLAAPACAQLEQAEAALAGALRLESGTVRLGTTEIAMRCLLIDAMGAFHARHPSIRFHIVNSSAAGALAALREGTVDLAVVPEPVQTARPLPRRSLSAFRDILIAGDAFSHLRGRRLSLAELEGIPLICAGHGTSTRLFLERFYQSQGLLLTPDMEPMSTDLILPMVRAGLGIGYIPEPLAREALGRGDVFPVALRPAPPARQVVLVTNPSLPGNLAADAFRAFLTGLAEEPPAPAD